MLLVFFSYNSLIWWNQGIVRQCLCDHPTHACQCFFFWIIPGLWHLKVDELLKKGFVLLSYTWKEIWLCGETFNISSTFLIGGHNPVAFPNDALINIFFLYWSTVSDTVSVSGIQHHVLIMHVHTYIWLWSILLPPLLCWGLALTLRERSCLFLSDLFKFPWWLPAVCRS